MSDASARRALFGVVAILLAVLLTVALVEIVGRVIRFDFDRQAAAQSEIPIYYRQPSVPLEGAYFHRAGPVEWRGQVLARLPEVQNAPNNPYRDEPAVTVRYDKDGFRNPEGLADWEIAVVGDSFVELGYLPNDELFTTVIASVTGCAVKNLGCSKSGPFSHQAYLRAFGRSPSLKQAVLVFYEENDVRDAAEEAVRRRRFLETGFIESRDIVPQSSFLRQVALVASRARHPAPRKDVDTNAVFPSAEGPVPITVHWGWKSADDFSKAELDNVAAALAAFAATARSAGAKPYLAFMPSKANVWRRHLAAVFNREMSVDRPLSDFVRTAAVANGFAFIDLTPPLIAASDGGVLTYNAVVDTHLTAAGSRIVGETIGAALKGDSARAPVPVRR